MYFLPFFIYFNNLIFYVSKPYENAGAHSSPTLFCRPQELHLLNFLSRSLSCLLVITLMITSTQIHAEKVLAREYFLKAAFLYNFARLVEWPESTFKTETAPFRLCFIGKEPFNKALRTLRNKKVNGRPLIIQRDINLSDTSQCQILFISQSEKNNRPDSGR